MSNNIGIPDYVTGHRGAMEGAERASIARAARAEGYRAGWDEAIAVGNANMRQQLLYTGERRVERDKALAELEKALAQVSALRAERKVLLERSNQKSVSIKAMRIALGELLEDPDALAAGLADKAVLRFAREYEAEVQSALADKDIDTPPDQDPAFVTKMPNLHASIVQWLRRAAALGQPAGTPSAQDPGGATA